MAMPDPCLAAETSSSTSGSINWDVVKLVNDVIERVEWEDVVEAVCVSVVVFVAVSVGGIWQRWHSMQTSNA